MLRHVALRNDEGVGERLTGRGRARHHAPRQHRADNKGSERAPHQTTVPPGAGAVNASKRLALLDSLRCSSACQAGMEGSIRIRRSSIAVLGAVVLFAVGGAGAVPATPTAVMLHLDGTHPLNNFHVGTFTAASPLCSAGSWQGHGNGTRTFTCTDGTGTFLSNFQGILEHLQGATGRWTITSGTGAYTSLRGKGRAHIDSSVGSDDDTTGPRPTFSDTWTGVVDFDATAPTGAFTKITVARPRASVRAWSVKVAFTAHDNVAANPVAFTATATAGSGFLLKSGTVRTGRASVVFTVRARSVRVVQIEISLSDPWGNEAAIKKTVRLR